MPPTTSSPGSVRQVEKSSPISRLRARDATSAPLTDQEFAALSSILAASSLGIAMGIEELDGFFSALIAGPRIGKPCDYWPVVLGKSMGDPLTLDYIRTTTVLLPLLARHWDCIHRTLERNKVHVPMLVEDESGLARGCNWARGFLRAVQLRAEVWSPLIASDEYGVAVLPMMILAHEDDPNALFRPPSLSLERRHEIIRLMAVGLIRAHRYFARTHSRGLDSNQPNLN